MGLKNTLQAELGLIVIEWSLMTLDISVEFFNHMLLLFRFAAVHLHLCTSKRHFYVVVRTLINRHDDYANFPSWDSFHNVENDSFFAATHI